MNDNLKKYIKEKVNYEIYREGKENNSSDEVIEKYLDGLYNWIFYIENNFENPIEPFNEIKARAEKLSNVKKQNFINNLIKILETRKNLDWQLNEIKSDLIEYRNIIKLQHNLENIKTFLEPISLKVHDALEQKKSIERARIEIFIKREDKRKELANKSNEENDPKSKPKLIQLLLDSDKKDQVITLVYNTFKKNLYIDIESKIFARHFIESDEDFIQISWLSEIEILKAFIDLLFKDFLAKPEKQNNVFIASHFNIDGKPILSRHLGNITSYPSYIEIYEKKNKEHPIVVLIKEIIDINKKTTS